MSWAPCSAYSVQIRHGPRNAVLRQPVVRRSSAVRASSAALDGKTAPGVQRSTSSNTRNGSHARPRTVSDSKADFMRMYVEKFQGPVLSPMYLAVMQELLVAAHLHRYSTKYVWDPVTSLGLVTVIRQVTDGLPDEQRDALLDSLIMALEQDPKQYRSAVDDLESWAAGKKESPTEALVADLQGDEVQKQLGSIAEAISNGRFAYSRALAVGLFRLLECTGSVDPTALNKLVQSLGLRSQSVTRDLSTYRSLLTRMQTAKELQREYIARERRKAAERETAKAAKQGGKGEPALDPADEAAASDKKDMPSSNVLRKGTSYTAE